MLFNKEVLENSETLQDEFINGFCEVMPSCYDLDKDCETSTPWCCPWYWDDGFQYDAENAYSAGMDHGLKYCKVIEELILKEEKENGIFRFIDRDDLDSYFNIPENYENFDSTFEYLKHENIKYSIDYDSNGNISEIVVHMPEKFNCFI